MMRFWEYFYSYVVIPLLWIVLQVLGIFNAKVWKGIRGRLRLFGTLNEHLAQVQPGKRIWFHASSMGEFEQAKPIIAELKARHPDVRVIVTFFSPSGYEHSRKYPLADAISYIPFDTRAGAKRFLDLVHPDAAVMVRYDIWPNHIWELRRRKIPLMIANATMRDRTLRRLPLARSFHHHIYDSIDAILTVSKTDVLAFRRFNLTHTAIEEVGDTRYDQVCQRSVEARRRHIIPQGILSNKQVVVVGSSWPEDEAVVIPAFLQLQKSRNRALMILVPHEPTVEHIEELESELRGKTSFIRFSGLNEYRGEHIIIVDSIGILMTLYAYAHIAFVGGSFRQGIHSVLEAAVYGIPVIFGPRHRNSQEPLRLVERGGAFIVHDSQELHRTLQNLLDDEQAQKTAGERAARFVQSNLGATERFLRHLEPHILDHRPMTTT